MKKTQNELLEMRNAMCEMKNALDRINDNLDIAEEKMSKLKDTTVEIIINKTQKKMNSISDQWDYFKHPDMHVIRVLKEGQRRKYS